MKLARITGTVTATAKDPSLVGKSMLIANVEDSAGNIIEKSLVAIDTVGAGHGDLVLIAVGSAARLPAGTTGVSTDAAIVAIVDHVN